MMGSTPTGGGGLSFEDVIGLLKDSPDYETKLREMQKRTEEARAMHRQAVEIGLKAEETKKFGSELLAKAEQQVLEAKQIREDAAKETAKAAAQAQALAEQDVAWRKQVEEQKVQAAQQLHATFAAREKEVAAKEQQLLGDTRKFEDRQADEQAKIEAFMVFKKGTEAKFAEQEADLRGRTQELADGHAEVVILKKELKEKLDKIKAIWVG